MIRNQKQQHQLPPLSILSALISCLTLLLDALLLNAELAMATGGESCSASTINGTSCSGKVVISFPFVTSDECHFNNSRFLISNCTGPAPEWPAFTRDATIDTPLGSSTKIINMFIPTRASRIQPSNNRLSYNSGSYGYINLTWSTSLLNQSNDICHKPVSSEQISQYIPQSINLQDFAHSAFNLDPSNIILLFGCNGTQANSSSDLTMSSSACTAYANQCQWWQQQNKSYNCYQYMNLSKELNLSQVMNGSGCKEAMFFVALSSSLPFSTWKRGMIRLNWSSIGTDWLASNIKECDTCLSMNRSCGYNASGDFQCYCNTSCPAENKPAASPTSLNNEEISKKTTPIGKKTLKTVIKVVAGFFATVLVMSLALLAILCFCKRRKAGNEKPWVKKPSFLSRKQDPNLVKEISYKELMRATETFADKNVLGDGGFGAVYRGVLADGLKVAVKRLHHDNYRRIEHFYNEIKVLSNLDHPNLVKLFGFCACENERELLLVFEYAPQGTLSDHLHGGLKPPLSWSLRLNIACEMADALSFLHNAVIPPIYHRDVKTANILLDDGFHAKLGDFGLSKLVPIKSSHVSTSPQGTPGYLDPEYHQCYQLTDKSDVYSFGVVLMELISGKLAVDMSRERGEVNLSTLAVMKIQCGLLEELVDPKLEMKKDPSVERSIKRVVELAFECLHSCRDDRPSMRCVAETLANIRREYEGAAVTTGTKPPSSASPSILFSSDSSCPSSNSSS